jgi:hypothetical protein
MPTTFPPPSSPNATPVVQDAPGFGSGFRSDPGFGPGPVIEPPKRRGSKKGTVVAIVAIGAICGFSLNMARSYERAQLADQAPTATVPRFEVPASLRGENDPPATTAPSASEPAAVASAASTPSITDLFADGQARPALDAIGAALGASPLMALSVVLYPEYAMANVQDPAQPEHVDSLLWRLGWVEAPQPVDVRYDGPLSDLMFDTAEVNWEAVPGLTAAALAETGVEGGEVTHVVVQRPLPFASEVRFRVFVTGPRDTGWLDADAQGNVLSVERA